ncbi:keratin-associated protein 12-1-like [Daphnia magna]|uniref:keratin-associated protein 12-1-like n=1 Tax=Daphnia magna TaxID=35525 RepID=UPI001E1BBAF4|nr:keratin-associated protein 12-1-like [Daphnia magna]
MNIEKQRMCSLVEVVLCAVCNFSYNFWNYTLGEPLDRYCQPSQPVSAQLPDCPACVFPAFLACVCPTAQLVSAYLPGLCLPGLRLLSCPACVCPATRPVSAQLPGLCLPSCPACVCPATRPVSAQLPGLCLPSCPAAQLVSAQLPGLCLPSCPACVCPAAILYLPSCPSCIC